MKPGKFTLTASGRHTGPFDLLSNVDNYTTPFETGISRDDLIAGYITQIIPEEATTVRIQSTGVCDIFTDVNIVEDNTVPPPPVEPPPGEVPSIPVIATTIQNVTRYSEINTVHFDRGTTSMMPYSWALYARDPESSQFNFVTGGTINNAGGPITAPHATSLIGITSYRISTTNAFGNLEWSNTYNTEI